MNLESVNTNDVKKQYYSWTQTDDKTVIKTMDKSVFEHRGSTIPIPLYQFFDADTLNFGSRVPIRLKFENKIYSAVITKERGRGCVRIFWFIEFNNIIHSKFNYEMIKITKEFPEMHFFKTNKNAYSITFQENIKIKKNTKTDSEIIEYIQYNPGKTKEDIIDYSGLSPVKFNKFITSNNLLVVQNHIFHKESIDEYEKFVNELKETIDNQILKNGGYTSSNLILDELYIHEEDEFFFYNPQFNNKTMIYYLSKRLFGPEGNNSYIFNSNSKTIWKIDSDLQKNYTGIMINEARKLDRPITRADIENILGKYGSENPYIAFCNLNNVEDKPPFTLVDVDKYEITEKICLSEEELKNLNHQLGQLFGDNQEYNEILPYRDIMDEFYSIALKKMVKNIKWNQYMLRSIINIFNTDYKSISAGNNPTFETMDAAIVSKKSQINNFKDLVLFELHKDLKKFPIVFKIKEFREYLIKNKLIGEEEKKETLYKSFLNDLRYNWSNDHKILTINE